MPLARVEIEQLRSDRWHVEFEGAGSSARRAHFNAASFDEAIAWLIEEFNSRAGREPTGPRSLPDVVPVDEAALAQQRAVEAKERAPIGRDGASRRRNRADAEAERADPGLSERRQAMEARRFARSDAS